MGGWEGGLNKHSLAQEPRAGEGVRAAHQCNGLEDSERHDGGGQTVLGPLALGRKTQADQARNRQRSKEGLLSYKSPICSKVPRSFLEELHQGPKGIRGFPRVETGVAWEASTIRAHQEPTGAGTLNGGRGTKKTGPGGEMKDQE